MGETIIYTAGETIKYVNSSANEENVVLMSHVTHLCRCRIKAISSLREFLNIFKAQVSKIILQWRQSISKLFLQGLHYSILNICHDLMHSKDKEEKHN